MEPMNFTQNWEKISAVHNMFSHTKMYRLSKDSTYATPLHI